ncbi:MAG: hypothetical protein ACR2KB_13045 [Chitinophagaceae bacterium]
MIIISETTTDALIGEDYSLLACFIMVSTLLVTDLLLAFVKDKRQFLGKLVDEAPLILADKGKALKK